MRATKQSCITLIWQSQPHRSLVLSWESILLMGFSKYLLFVEDSRFHLGFINGPFSEVSHHQCHIKFSLFLLVLSPPTNNFFANLSFYCSILTSRNPEIHSEIWDTFRIWDKFRKDPSAISNSTASLPLSSNPWFPWRSDAHLPLHSLSEFLSTCFAYKHSLCVILYLSFLGYLGCHTRDYWKQTFLSLKTNR